MVRRSPRVIKNSSSSGSGAASSSGSSSALSTPPSLVGKESVSLDFISGTRRQNGKDLEVLSGTDDEENDSDSVEEVDDDDDDDDESFKGSSSDSDDVLTTTRRREIADSSEVGYNTADEGGGFIVEDSDDILSPPSKRRRPTRRREWPNQRPRQPELIDIHDGEQVITIKQFDDGEIALASSGEDHGEEHTVVEVEPVRHQNRKKRAPKKTPPYFDDFERQWYTNTERELAKLYYRHDYLKRALDEIEPVVPKNDGTVGQPKNMAFNLLPFQLEGLYWLKVQEQGRFRGGILADEMGMGKTIQTIALLLTEPRMKPNLIVMPTVALMQWKSEIEMHSKGSLSVYIFHGANREKSASKLLDYDVILTTYTVIESTYRKEHYGFKRTSGVVKEKSPLHQIEFKRVILDEAHNIKDRANNTSKAVFAVKSDYRWCLSGTPLQNRIGELYSLIKFLRAEPFSNYFCKKCPCTSRDWDFIGNSRCRSCGHRPMEHTSWFGTELLKPIQNHGSSEEGRAAFTKLHKLLKGIMLRRTKVERADDMGLPPRIVEVRRDYFNEEELDLYRSIFSNSKRQFNTYVRQGVVLNNYANIFTLITRMRQIADHPDLVLRKQGGQQDNSIVCCLCDDEAQEAIESRCHHTFCRVCIREYVEGFTGEASELTCPVCHVPLVIDLSAPAKQVDEEVVKKGSIINRIDMGRWHSSTKIEALLEELYKLRSDRQTIKSIVFSQFTSMLDLVEWRLKRAGFQLVKLQGSMSPLQRESTINHFMNTPSCEIFLVSLKAGGVALNLCEASQVFILDPWWNPSVEWQSGDRVHRIGQHRPVKITRLVIEDSIESRIIELQAKKADMIEATIGQDDTAMNRLTQQDMEFLFG